MTKVFQNSQISLGWFYLPTTEVHLRKRFELEISNHNTSQQLKRSSQVQMKLMTVHGLHIRVWRFL